MSAPAFAWALEQGAALGLTPAERLVLIYLADQANGDRFCFPGQPRIAKFTGLALRTVISVLKKLEDRQLIRAETASGRVTRYHIIRDQTPANGAVVDPQTPANRPGVTPANRPVVSGHTPANRPGVPLQMVQPTPANRPVDPSSTQEERKNRFLPEPDAPATAAASPSPRDELWREGVRYTQGLLGCMEGSARSFLGKLLKLANDDASRVLALLRKADQERPLDAGAWLIANAKPFRNAGLAVIADEGFAIEGAAAMQRLLAAEAKGHA